MDYEKLIEKAFESKKNSYSPYSNFRVGACLLTKSGKMFTGCNVENSAYGSSICAERVAITKAVSEGEQEFVAIAIISDANKFTYPCGLCRQVMSEFSENLDVIVCKSTTEYKVHSLSELLPFAFNLDNL